MSFSGMKIYIGADHNGFLLKSKLVTYLQTAGYTVVDDGSETLQPEDDFPVITKRVVSDVLANDARGIVICGSGQGACMSANRFKGVRACLGYDKESARASRNDDDSNIICLPARTLDVDEAKAIVDTWLNTPFANAPRFIRRLKELDEF